MNKRSCKHCGQEFSSNPGPGKPREFCKPACSLAYRRAHPKPIPSKLSSALSQLHSIQSRQPTVTHSTRKPFNPYESTTNDANISAMIAGHSNNIPYPEGGAIPLSLLSPSQIRHPHLDDSPPTF